MGRSIEEVWQSRACVNIGKSGLTEGVISELRRRLKEERMIKVRVLKNCPLLAEFSRREVAAYVARAVDAELVSVRGYAFILRSKEFKRG